MRRARTAIGMTGALALGLAVAAPVAAQDAEAQSFTADLASLNDSGATGTATVEVTGSEATVTIETSEISPGLPHAQHIHIGGENTCPPADAAGDDDLIDTVEGQPFYGEIQVSLTTEGDVGADSALAVERFPVADADGTLTYERTFDLPEGVTAEDLANGVIVQHGIAALSGDEAMYDGDAVSPLDESLPLEATIPATCGELTAAEGGEGATTTTVAGEAEAEETTTTAAEETTTTTAAAEEEQETTTTTAPATTTTAQVGATPQGGVAGGAGGTAGGEDSVLPLAAAIVAGSTALGATALVNRRRAARVTAD